MRKAEGQASRLDEIVPRTGFDRVSGEAVDVEQSAIDAVSGSTVSLRQTAVRSVTAEDVVRSQSCAASVRGGHVELKESAALLTVGERITAQGSRVVFLLSPSVSGPVNAVFTLPAAFALGLGYAVGRIGMPILGRLATSLHR